MIITETSSLFISSPSVMNYNISHQMTVLFTTLLGLLDMICIVEAGPGLTCTMVPGVVCPLVSPLSARH